MTLASECSVSLTPEKMNTFNKEKLSFRPSFFDKFAYYLVPARRKIVLDNIRLAFGSELAEDEVIKLAQCFYGHCARIILENLGTSWMSEDQIRKQVRVVGHEIVMKEAQKGRGVLLLTGHFGNWEITPIGAVLQFTAFKNRFHIVRRLLTNKTFEKILFRRFYKAGLNVIPKKNALSQVLAALKNNDVVAFIMDQYARPDRDGICVEFFGKKAGTFKSLALIARETGAPVVPALCYRESHGKHVMRFYEPLPWIEDTDHDREIYLNTLQYNKMLEKMIRSHPDQWFWFHRRWKNK